MIIFFSLFIFVFGLIIGSFLNSIIYRLETGESFLLKRSYCPHCKHKLFWQDLIPVLSFLILKGRCRYCQQKISFRYPLIELATATLFVLIANYTFPNLLVTSYWLLITCFLIIIFVYDLKHYIIPDKIIYSAIAIAVVYHLLRFDLLGRSNLLLSAFGAAAFFLIIVLVSRGRWMGVGDIKLAFFMGLVLGWPNILVALFLAFFLGAIIGIGLIVAGKKKLKSEIPFGPFLVTGTFLAMFFGERLINWYLRFFLLQ
jgi:prepilin signal peptidase PulO-like enzyme (type II secretory pathway)